MVQANLTNTTSVNATALLEKSTQLAHELKTIVLLITISVIVYTLYLALRSYVYSKIEKERIKILKQLAESSNQAAAIAQVMELLEWVLEHEKEARGLVTFYRLREDELREEVRKELRRLKISVVVIIALFAILVILMQISYPCHRAIP